MDWLTELQSNLRDPVFAFLASTWQYLLIAAIGIGWYMLYSNARRDRAAAPVEDAEAPPRTSDDATAVPGQFGRRAPNSRAASSGRRAARSDTDTTYYPMSYGTASTQDRTPDRDGDLGRSDSTTDHSDSGDSDGGGGDGGGGD